MPKCTHNMQQWQHYCCLSFHSYEPSRYIRSWTKDWRVYKNTDDIIIIRHAPCQCVAPLATNSLHSDLSKASSIASSKVRLCRDRSLFKWPSRRCRGAQLAWSNRSDEHQSESSWRQLSRPFWPGGQTTSLLFCTVAMRGGCSVILLTSQLETRWYQRQRISRILLRHHWSSASIFLTSALDRAQHSDPYSIIGKMQMLRQTENWKSQYVTRNTEQKNTEATTFSQEQ